MKLKLKSLAIPFSEKEGTNFVASVEIVSVQTGRPIGAVDVSIPFIPESSKSQTLDQIEALALEEARKQIGIDK